MPEVKLAEMSVEELEKKYGTKAKVGKISITGNKVYVAVDGKKSELKANLNILS